MPFTFLAYFITARILVFSSEDAGHNHASSFLGDYAKSVLKWEPKKLEEKLYWLVEQRLDQDGDMKLSGYELKHWMEKVYHENLQKRAMGVFFDCNKKEDHELTFTEYRTCVYSQADTPAPTDKSEQRMQARWRLADEDGNYRLSLEEFSVFHAPSEPHNQRMHSLLVDEYIEDRDSDGDMHLTVHELMASETEDEKRNTDWEEDIWKRFKNIDTNEDGLLSHPEIEHDLFPSLTASSSVDEEILHILGDADDDKDGLISYDEMLANLQVFIGTQVLQQGKILLRDHDEL